MKEHARQSSLAVLEKLPRLFDYADAGKLTGNANVFLTRALKAGHVVRLAKGSYFNCLMHRDQRPTIEEVACFVRRPTYISCEWAMNYHGVLLQVPTVCTAVTLHSTFGSRNKVKFGDRVIEYSSITERLFFGFETRDGVSMASAEKALLDVIYLRKYVPFPDELELEHLNPEKLKKFSAPYPARTQLAAGQLFANN
jgi:predicted transcriptional regulator of viral defense system